MARSRVHLSLDETTMKRLQELGAAMLLPSGRVVDQLALEALKKIEREDAKDE